MVQKLADASDPNGALRARMVGVRKYLSYLWES
jgi:hypothetical protein